MIETQILYSSGKFARSVKLSKGKKQLITPTYFPAISGTHRDFKAFDLVRIITQTHYPRMLISAYDCKSESSFSANLGEISEYFRTGSFVMLDSGIFELSRTYDEHWNFEEYKVAVNEVDSDFYCTYDLLPNDRMSNPAFTDATLRGIRKSLRIKARSQGVSVTHGNSPAQLIYVSKKLVKALPEGANFVAFPERECGATILDRARTILALRRLFGDRDKTVIHLLGCGNPISMAVYAYCGADMFDSLDWTSCVVNRSSLGLSDISHVPIMSCNCAVCSNPPKNPLRRALLHNLLFYQDFVLKMQSMIRQNTLRDFLIEMVGARLIEQID